jgi:hypothetical protein
MGDVVLFQVFDCLAQLLEVFASLQFREALRVCVAYESVLILSTKSTPSTSSIAR